MRSVYEMGPGAMWVAVGVVLVSVILWVLVARRRRAVVSDDSNQLPERGLVSTLPCAGEKDHENTFGDNVVYVTSVQTEVLTDHLYLGTFNEMLEHGQELNALMSVWTEDVSDKPSLSLLDMQRFADEVHVQSYHLRTDCGLVLRSQSIFQLKPD